jgi:hypothetical protein
MPHASVSYVERSRLGSETTYTRASGATPHNTIFGAFKLVVGSTARNLAHRPHFFTSPIMGMVSRVMMSPKEGASFCRSFRA